MKIATNLLLMFVLLSASCGNRQNTNDSGSENIPDDKVKVVYFHYTDRCVTCNAVEKAAKEAVEQMAADDVVFLHYNLEEPEGEKAGKKYKAAGQTLLVVSGDHRYNLTTDAFMYARGNREKVKEMIQEKIKAIKG